MNMKNFIISIILILPCFIKINGATAMRDTSPGYQSGSVERYDDKCEVLSAIALNNDTMLVLQKKMYGNSANEVFSSRYLIKNGTVEPIPNKNRNQYLGRTLFVDKAQLIRYKGVIHAVVFSQQNTYGTLDIYEYNSVKGWNRIRSKDFSEFGNRSQQAAKFKSRFMSAVVYQDYIYILLEGIGENLFYTTFDRIGGIRDFRYSFLPKDASDYACMQTCNVGAMRRIIYTRIIPSENATRSIVYFSPDLDNPESTFDFEYSEENTLENARWGTSECPINMKISEINGLTMMQGSIEGITDNNVEAPPMQVFFSCPDRQVVGEVFNYEIPVNSYYPYFPPSIPIREVRYTDLPYGSLASCSLLRYKPKTANSNYNYDLYKQNIILIRSHYNWYNNRMHWASIGANSIRTKKEDYKSTINDPACRDLVKLIGIFEGPPPCAVNPKYWKESGGSYTEFSFSKAEEKTFSTSRSIDFEIMIGSAAKFPVIKTEYEVMAGYALSNMAGTSKTITETYTLSLKANSKDMFVGTALYSLPTITTYSGTICSPDNTVEYNTSLPPVTRMTGLGYAVKHFNLSNAPFSIDGPEYLDSWVGQRFMGEPGNLVSNYTSAITVTPYVTQKIEVKIADETKSSTSHTLKESAKLLLPFYKLDQKFSTKWTDNTTTKITNTCAMTFAPGNKNAWRDKDDTQYIKSYTCEMVGLKYDNGMYPPYNAVISSLNNHMIGENKDFPLMIQNENPFYIGWRVTNIEKGTNPDINSIGNDNSGQSGAEENSNNNEINTKAYINGDNIVVTAQPSSFVTIYNMQGVLLKQFEMQSTLMEADLIGRGIYIVNIQSPDGNIKTFKIQK